MGYFSFFNTMSIWCSVLIFFPGARFAENESLMSLRESEDELTPSVWGSSAEYWEYGKRGVPTDDSSETKSNSWEAMPNLSILEQLSQEMTCKGPQQAEVQLRFVPLIVVLTEKTLTNHEIPDTNFMLSFLFYPDQVHVADVPRRRVPRVVFARCCAAQGCHGRSQNSQRSQSRYCFSRNACPSSARSKRPGQLDR
jgi:hypothetical protein